MKHNNVRWMRQELRSIENRLNDPNYFVNDQQKRYWIDRANDIKFGLGLGQNNINTNTDETH